jgi:hypothetical protein
VDQPEFDMLQSKFAIETVRSMPELKLEFRIDTSRRLFESLVETGPLFCKWIPDGKSDAVSLTRADEQEQISVWFELRMIVDHGLLHWKPDGTQFDPGLRRIQPGPLV